MDAQSPTRLDDAAKKCVDLANGSVVEAARLLEEQCLKDRLLYDSITRPALPQLCYEQVRGFCRDERNRIWNAPGYDETKKGVRAVVMGRENLRMLFQLPTIGKYLRDATKTEVAEAAKFYENQASNMSWKSRWLLRIADRLHGRQKVGKVFTEQELCKLQEETSHE